MTRDSDCTDDGANSYLESQHLDSAKSYSGSQDLDGANSYSQSQDLDDAKIDLEYQDSDDVNIDLDSDNEFDNRLKNYQDQMEIQLKHVISLSTQNYVLCHNQEAVKSNDSFVCNLQDLANHLTNTGETLQRNSFEMTENMSTSINDPHASS